MVNSNANRADEFPVYKYDCHVNVANNCLFFCLNECALVDFKQ